MNFVSLLGGLLTVSAGPLPPVESPPLPDFKERVDYVAWYHEQMRFASGDNALDMYGTFLYGSGQAPVPVIAPAPATSAARQLRALLEAPKPWRPRKQRALAAWAARIEARYLLPFTDGVKRHHFAPRGNPQAESLPQIGLPKLVNGRAIGQMMFARAWRVIDDTIVAGHFLEAVRSNLVFANHIGFGLTLEEQFFAAGHRSFVYGQLRGALSSSFRTARAWKEILEVLDQYDSVPVTRYFERSLYSAEARALELLQRFCTVPRDGEPTPSPKINVDAVSAYLASSPGRMRLTEQDLERLADMDPIIIGRLIHEYHDSMRRLLAAGQVTDLTEKVRMIEADTVHERPLLQIFFTPAGLLVQSAYRTEATRRLVRVVLSMAVSFKETGKWPASLDELTGPGVAEWRIDPFTGRDFLLKTEVDRTIPYSAGPNGVADGGHQSKDVIFRAKVAEDAAILEGATPASQPASRPTTQPAPSP